MGSSSLSPSSSIGCKKSNFALQIMKWKIFYEKEVYDRVRIGGVQKLAFHFHYEFLFATVYRVIVIRLHETSMVKLSVVSSPLVGFSQSPDC